MRKKSISLIVVLTFLMTLFPLALPAFAADYSRIGSVLSVNDNKVVQLNRVKAEFSAGELADGDEVIISLPSGFEFCDGIPAPADNPDGKQAQAAWAVDSANKIVDADSAVIGTVTILDDNEIKLTYDTGGTDEFNTEDLTVFIYLGAVYVDEGYEGDIPLKIDGVPGSGFDDAEVVVGRVTGGAVEIEVTDSETFSDEGEVTLRLVEDMMGALEADPESVKLILPDGFIWAINEDGGGEGEIEAGDDDGVKIIYGAGITGTVAPDSDDEAELIIDIDNESTKASCIEIKAEIKVDDETEAELGDIVAKVKGESDVSPSTIVVGAYGEYDFEINADDPETVYAGMVEQEIANFTIEESIENTLVAGRTVTLTLPDWAKWGALPDSVSDGVTLNLVGFPGKDGQSAKYEVVGSSTSAGELEFEDMEVVLSPKAPVGDLTITFGGTAGVKGDITVASVAKPFVLQVADPPILPIGTADLALGEITVTEAEEGLISENRPLVLILPDDISWEDYEVEVAEGDLEIEDYYDKVNPVNGKNYLYIDIEDDSNEPSVIKVTTKITVLRTVPEGRVVLALGGPAVIETQDPAKLIGQYGSAAGNGYFQIHGLDVVEADGVFPLDDTTAGAVAAFIGTPAPGELQIKAVFTIGSTDYTLNGVAQTMDVAPYAKDGRTYLPMRYVAKALGITDSGIMWKNGTATFISANKVVSVTVGSKVMTINGAPVPIDAAPEIVSGRTMLPIRWIATAFDIDLHWDSAAQTVTVE